MKGRPASMCRGGKPAYRMTRRSTPQITARRPARYVRWETSVASLFCESGTSTGRAPQFFRQTRSPRRSAGVSDSRRRRAQRLAPASSADLPGDPAQGATQTGGTGGRPTDRPGQARTPSPQHARRGPQHETHELSIGYCRVLFHFGNNRLCLFFQNRVMISA